MILRQVLVMDQSQPLWLRRLNGRMPFLGGTCQAKEGPQGLKVPVTPLRCVNVGP